MILSVSFLKAIKVTKDFQKSQIQQQLSENSLNLDSKSIESELFEMEINILDSKLDIIAEEEKLINQKKNILETEVKHRENIEEFFDAIEDEKEMESFVFNQTNDLSKENQKLLALKTKLSKLYQKRAFLRNKRKSLLSKKTSKQLNVIKEKQNFEKHHKIQTKRSNKSVEDKHINQKFEEIRRKTLERLRNYKLKSLMKNEFESNLTIFSYFIPRNN